AQPAFPTGKKDPSLAPADEVLSIPPSRLIYPGNMAQLARQGLLRKTVRSRDRKMVLKINYDVELPLVVREFQRPLLISIPVVARGVCPDCRGSDTHCAACRGKGWHKVTRTIRLRLDGGLVDGQILEIPLRSVQQESL